MRKSLWLLSVVLLYVTIASTSAKADPVTIVESGGVINAIDNLSILGDAYDVTFGLTATPTFTFSSETDATVAATDINDALNGMAVFPNVIEGDNPGVAYYLIPYAISTGHYVTVAVECSDMTAPCDSSYSILSSDFVLAGNSNSGAYAEFTLIPTPEPGTLGLVTVLAGLLGLMLALRKRKAQDQSI
jgi:hypothetical protein